MLDTIIARRFCYNPADSKQAPEEWGLVKGRRRSVSHVVGLLAAMWFASQIQRFALAAYVGASTLMPDLGITAAAAGFLAAVYFPVYGAMQIPSGILADQADPRRNILIGGCLVVLAGLAFALAPGLEAAVAARIAVGLSAGLLWLSLIKIASLLPGGAYARRLSTLMGVGAVGSVVGLGGLPALLSFWSWRIVAALVTVPTIVAVVLLLGAGCHSEGSAGPAPATTTDSAEGTKLVVADPPSTSPAKHCRIRIAGDAFAAARSTLGARVVAVVHVDGD